MFNKQFFVNKLHFRAPEMVNQVSTNNRSWQIQKGFDQAALKGFSCFKT